MSMWMYLLLFLLPLLVTLIYRNHVVQYYIKLSVYYVILSTIGTGIIFLALFTGKSVNNFRHAAKAFKFVRRLYGIKVEVKGGDNLNSEEPYILVCNHQSSLDLMSMAEIVPEKCTCLAKQEMKYRSGPFGLAVWLSGAIFIDRRNHERALSTMSYAVETIHREKYKIWIFPEGTRHLGETLLPFKKGAFHLAVQAQVPVVPVVFSSYSSFINRKEKTFTPGSVTITCMPPIPTKGMTSEDVNDLTAQVRNKMVEAFEKTSPSLHAKSNGKIE